MQSGVRRALRSLFAAALCICSTPLLAEELILRCDGSSRLLKKSGTIAYEA